MTKTTLGILAILLLGAIILGGRTILFSPGSTATILSESSSGTTSPASFVTQTHKIAPSTNTYVPFSLNHGLQGTQRSRGKNEPLEK